VLISLIELFTESLVKKIKNTILLNKSMGRLYFFFIINRLFGENK